MTRTPFRGHLHVAAWSFLLAASLFLMVPARAEAATAKKDVDPALLSKEDKNKVLAWMSKQILFESKPYCYRRSYGRGVGTIPGRVADCPSGYTNNGATCGRGAHTISAPSKVADCPSGFTNMGLTCYQGPSTYGKGCTTIFKKFGCRPGYTDNGCFCGRGARSLGASSMVCPSGYHRSKITARCIKDCPAGYKAAQCRSFVHFGRTCEFKGGSMKTTWSIKGYTSGVRK